MRFTIPLPPEGFQRPGNRAGGGRYSPHTPMLNEWRRLVINQLRLNSYPIIEGPVSVSIAVGADSTDFEIIPVIGAEPARPEGVKFDLDNIFKFDADMLQKAAYFDDAQIVDLSARFKGEQ